MKRTDEFNNYDVLNPDGAQRFDENFISESENGGDFVFEDSSSRFSENQKFDELADDREFSENYGSRRDNVFDETRTDNYGFSENSAISNGAADGAAGVSASAAGTATAAATSGSVLTGVATTVASFVVAVVVAVAVLIPSIKVSQIFANAYSMAFSVEFSSPLFPETENEKEKEEVFWYAELTGDDDFSQRVELREQSAFFEFYDLVPDTPYTLTIYRNEEAQYSEVFYTAKEESKDNEIFIEVFDFENEGFRFNFFVQGEEDIKKLYTVRVIDEKGNVVFVEDVSSPREEGFFVNNVKGNAYITVSTDGEVKAFRNVEYWYEPVDLQYYTVTYVADGQTVGVYSYRYDEGITYTPEVPYKEGYIGEWGQIPQYSTTVYAVYTPVYVEVQFTAMFCVDGELYDTRVFTGEYENLTDLPEVPEKPGYYGEWSLPERPGNFVFQIFAEYTPITYTATFIADGEIIAEIPFTVEDESIDEPEVPEKDGFVNAWEAYKLSASDITINAIYADTVRTATFTVDNDVYTVRFVPGSNIDEPELPVREGYEGEWDYYDETEDGDIYARAVYTPITYTATFVADGETVDVVEFTVEDNGISMPDFPEKSGYEGWWEEFTLEAADITINAEYEPITYTATFIANGQIVAEIPFTIEDKTINAPEVPESETQGFVGAWEAYAISAQDLTINAIYTDTMRTATFTVDNEVYTVNFVPGSNIDEPEIPARDGYSGKWDYYETTDEGDIYARAVYELITYTATFIADEEPVEERTFTVENMFVNEPEVPGKEGYTGKWEDYELGTSDITVNAVYKIITYTATFVADGKTVTTKPFTIKSKTITAPEITEKEGYTGAWEEYSVVPRNITINAIYTPITYTATFVVDGEIIDTVEFTVETEVINEPQAPEKSGYEVTWEPYSPVLEDITVNAVYTPITYTATFIADGRTIAEVSFTVEDGAVNEPPVPEKQGFAGAWEAYTITASDMTVNAIYTDTMKTATFMNGNDVVAVVRFVPGGNISEPELPPQEGYEGSWDYYDETEDGDVYARAVYTPIIYTATFVADGEIVDTVEFTVETEVINEPQAPEMSGYEVAWEPYGLVLEDITVNAVYTPIIYTATFVADGEIVDTVEFTVETEVIDEPTVPERNGYIGEWSEYSVEPQDITIEAMYELIEGYRELHYIVDDVTVEIVTYSVDDEMPYRELDYREGYTAEWQYRESADDPNVIYAYAVYTLIVDDPTQGQGYFTVFYRVNGDYVTSMQYPKDTGIQPFDYPYGDEGYIISDWRYTPVGDDSEDMYADADYTPVIDNPIYITVHYMVDGEEIETVVYLQGDDMPSREVPERKGFTGEWQYRESADEPDVIYAYALYTQIADDPTQGQGNFTVFYRVNGVIEHEETYPKDTPATEIPPYIYTDNGYIINDWEYTPFNDGSGNMYADPKVTTSGDDPTFGNMTNIGN